MKLFVEGDGGSVQGVLGVGVLGVGNTRRHGLKRCVRSAASGRHVC